jgi:ERF superfamily
MVNESEKTIEHKNIGEAWLAIMEEVGYVQKLGLNKAQNYKYAGEAQLIEALRPALIKHKVICIPSEAKVAMTACDTVTETKADGTSIQKKTHRTVAEYTYVYTHVPSNTHIQVEVIGEGVDTGDKAAYKGATGGLKYALRQPFLIETGDEPEAHDVDVPAGKAVFSNASLRKTFCDNVIKSFDAAETIAQLEEIAKLNKQKFAEMDSGSEHDQLGVDELRKRYSMAKVKIEAWEAEARESLGRLNEQLTPRQ